MRCKECKEKFEPIEFLQKFCKGNDDCLAAEALYNLKKIKEKQIKDWNKEKPQRKIKAYSNRFKKELESNINKLSKMIDKSFGHVTCIDCDSKMDLIHAAHFHNVSGNENLRYNLDVIHSARAYCNQYSSEHKVGYRTGLEKRYGKDYLEYVQYELPMKYEHLGLKSNEIHDALQTVRKLIKTFDTYKFKDARQAREMCNKIIRIYK